MGILGKPKKTKPLMVRLSKPLVDYIDGQCLKEYTSRPDYIISAIRRYRDYVISHENLALLMIEGKELSDEGKRHFYFEYLKKQFTEDRENYMKWEWEKIENVDILLSIMPNTLEKINEIVERTKFFKNHQDFIKIAVTYSKHKEFMNCYMEERAEKFLEDPQRSIKKQKEFEEIAEILKKDNWEEELVNYKNKNSP